MKTTNYVWQSLGLAAGVVLYVTAVSWFMLNAEDTFPKEDSLLQPLMMLLLFVVSATITSSLVLGRPIHLYLSGLKREAFILLAAILGWLVLSFISLVVIFTIDF